MEKKKRILAFVSILAWGMFLGMVVLAAQLFANRMLSQQSQILKSQKGIEQALKVQFVPETSIMTDVLKAQKDLIARVARLENTLNIVKANLGDRQAKRQAPPSEDYNKVHEIPVEHSQISGSKDSPITIVEFADFQCPYCAKFHGPILEVLKAYPGKVKYVLKNFPLGFHKEAKPASKAAFAAGEQGKYWEMVELLLENGKNLNQEKFEELAKEIGLNVKKFLKALKDNDAKYEEFIKKDIDLAGKIGVRGTPTFFLDGKKTRARNFEGFKKEIDAILNKK
ncbi:MAG: thioredoxin domain-containing protein [Candidatus Zapsychrus exili]|nr:thioredoxin domain-containing protein [Candidatus Zapsychrus exili]